MVFLENVSSVQTNLNRDWKVNVWKSKPEMIVKESYPLTKYALPFLSPFGKSHWIIHHKKRSFRPRPWFERILFSILLWRGPISVLVVFIPNMILICRFVAVQKKDTLIKTLRLKSELQAAVPKLSGNRNTRYCLLFCFCVYGTRRLEYLGLMDQSAITASLWNQAGPDPVRWIVQEKTNERADEDASTSVALPYNVALLVEVTGPHSSDR